MREEKTVRSEGSVPFCPKVIKAKFANKAAWSLMILSPSDGENEGCGPPGCRLPWTLEVCLQGATGQIHGR